MHHGSDEEASTAIQAAIRLSAAAGSLTQHIRLALLFAAHPGRLRPAHLRAVSLLCGPPQESTAAGGKHALALAAKLDGSGALSPAEACAAVLATLDERARETGENLDGAADALNAPHIADGAALPVLLDLLDIFAAAAGRPGELARLAWIAACGGAPGRPWRPGAASNLTITSSPPSFPPQEPVPTPSHPSEHLKSTAGSEAIGGACAAADAEAAAMASALAAATLRLLAVNLGRAARNPAASRRALPDAARAEAALRALSAGRHPLLRCLDCAGRAAAKGLALGAYAAGVALLHGGGGGGGGGLLRTVADILRAAASEDAAADSSAAAAAATGGARAARADAAAGQAAAEDRPCGIEGGAAGDVWDSVQAKGAGDGWEDGVEGVVLREFARPAVLARRLLAWTNAPRPALPPQAACSGGGGEHDAVLGGVGGEAGAGEVVELLATVALEGLGRPEALDAVETEAAAPSAAAAAAAGAAQVGTP